mmetsp:Transcript_69403/g.219251  ORF Transcript_69403/g.219251 Transcript_69403/m.219251 type:complete len:633 (-) Transcript_69403:31-1929(-)
MAARAASLLSGLLLFPASASGSGGGDSDPARLFQHLGSAGAAGVGMAALGPALNASADAGECSEVPLTPVLNVRSIPGVAGPYTVASVPGLMLPDATEPYQAFWEWERRIWFSYSRDQFGRAAGVILPVSVRFGQLAAQGRRYGVSVLNEDMVASVLATGAGVAPPGWRPYLQGVDVQALADGGVFAAGQPWRMDDFLGSVITAAHQGLYLSATTQGVFLQDFSPAGSRPAAPREGALTHRSAVQIVQRMLQEAPATILRTSAALDATTRAAVEIELFDATGRRLGPYTPRDGIRWFLAKRAVAATNFFVANAMHAAIHLFLGIATAAMQNVLPQASVLRRALAPNTFMSVDLAVLEAETVFGKDGSVFGTGVYDVPDIDAFNAALRDFARFVLAAPLSETVGCKLPKGGRPRCPAPWWSAGAVEFLPAVQAWADAMAGASLADPLSRSGLARLPRELAGAGLLAPGAPHLRLHTRKGLADFLTKFVFTASVFHGQHLSMREIMLTPLSLGGAFSAPLLQVLDSPNPPMTEAEALELAYPGGANPTEFTNLPNAYFVSTTAVQATPIGTGPYDLEGSNLEAALERFRDDLNAARATVSGLLPKNGSGFAPLQLFPLEEIRTVGLTVAQGAQF